MGRINASSKLHSLFLTFASIFANNFKNNLQPSPAAASTACVREVYELVGQHAYRCIVLDSTVQCTTIILVHGVASVHHHQLPICLAQSLSGQILVAFQIQHLIAFLLVLVVSIRIIPIIIIWIDGWGATTLF